MRRLITKDHQPENVAKASVYFNTIENPDGIYEDVNKFIQTCFMWCLTNQHDNKLTMEYATKYDVDAGIYYSQYFLK